MPQINSLDWLFYPITKQEFLKEYFEKKVLHVKLNQSRDARYYHELLTRKSFDFFLNEQNVKYPDVQLVGTPPDFKHRDYLYHDNSVNISKLYKYYYEGATINVVGLNNYLMPLGRLCEHLTKETSHRYQTNIYCTPKNTQGFKTHYDSHDVIVLQIHGSKEWEIYDSPVELPLKGPQNFQPDMDLNPTLKETLTLKEGELLYIPRGVMHNAKTTETSSIHITLGLMGTTMYRLISNYFEKEALENIDFRRYIPFGYLNNSDIKQQLKESLKKLILDIDNHGLDYSVDAMEDEVIKQLPAKVLGQLEQIDNLNENLIKFENKTFSLRKNLIIKSEIVNNELIIKVNGSAHSFPDYVEGTFKIICSKDEFTLKDLGNDLDDEGKEVFLEFLLKEAVITVL